MSEILGHDMDGTPVRAGDRVMLVGDSWKETVRGHVTTVKGPASPVAQKIISTLEGRKVTLVTADPINTIDLENCRRVDDKPANTPADVTFDQMMQDLKQGVEP